MSVLSAPHFHDEEAAYAFVEARVWPDGPICPHCGGYERIGKMGGKSTRIGTYKCYQCRKPFTVKVGTVFESSHVPLHKWLQAMYLLCASKKGISSNQLHRTLGVTLKTAWFMSHRIREAMRDDKLSPLGGEGFNVEADETFVGTKRPRRVRTDPKTGKTKIERGTGHKHAVMALVERGGRARSIHVDKLDRATVYGFVLGNIDPASRLHTDEATHYRLMKRYFKGGHARLSHHTGEYVRGQDHTNTIEGFFSIFKRGMRGVYQHCGSRHLQRYLAEFDFRYNQRVAFGVDDEQRTERALAGIVGKRLTYRTTARA